MAREREIYQRVLYLVVVYFCTARAANNTTVNQTATDEVNTKVYVVEGEVELNCPLDAERLDDHAYLQWLSPRFSLISKSSVNEETGIFLGDSRLTLTTNGSLTINPACCLDVGTYKCSIERINADGTRLVVVQASVSLAMNATDDIKCDTLGQSSSCDPTTTTSGGDTDDDVVINSVAVYIGTFICGVILGVIFVHLAHCVAKRYRNRRHRRIVAKLRQGSVALSARGGSVIRQTSRQTEKDTQEPNQFDMVTNPLQDENGILGDPFAQAPSPPPRVEHQDQSSLGISRGRGLSPGRLTVAIHASSLQELNTVGSASDTAAHQKNPQKPALNSLSSNSSHEPNGPNDIYTTDVSNATAILTALDAELSLEDDLAFTSTEYTKGKETEEEDDGYLRLCDCSDDYQGVDGIMEKSRDESRPKGDTPFQHDYTSMRHRMEETPLRKSRTSSSDDYEHLDLFSPRGVSFKGRQAAVGRFNTSYLRPMLNYEHSNISGRDANFPLPPPPVTIAEESSRSQSGSHTSLPLPPPPVDLPEGPFYVVLDNKGYTTLQNTTSTWPRRVSAKRRYPSIAVTKDAPEYLEIIASADCIYNSASDEYYF